ncbi:SGNH/GDSL hydrolase family protein [Neptunicoccus sediminis]|uniref:SGNH/GDSL hydrolase family protein n=1 Tax=Neptunicoccus sediminis TaxID=1892596 RepID=UPI000845F806|nr:SGNH/GDSL hydrolase family protein [Neptunicoccus sediminis]
MKFSASCFAALCLFLSGCTESVSRDSSADILAMGDSLLASHGLSGNAVSDVLERALGRAVIDRSVMGARIIYHLPVSGSAGLNIGKQFRAGDWDWVILNGGGNDLWLGCGCVVCKGKLDKLARKDGKGGRIPSLIADIRKTGAKVVYVGYLRSPGLGSPIEHCRDEGDELERRIARFATFDDGVHMVSLKDLVPFGDRSFHAADMIHPSRKGSAAIAARVAAVIRKDG